ncbi:MFS transporter [Maritimibacter sp. HL-12]|uniref:MFS transporter n=1 Tax=Maritimibacter sp. HL-12 TaxID=1162418 RepID=UPI000A0F21CC|nr:MFS transporter [Maritimibacter sp. HL-12]SMH40992.1 Predicted arabinose efflux permease, MFS family [Maritimibacter sp. HL-12]
MTASWDNDTSGLGAIRGNAQLRRLLVAQAPADLADWLDFTALAALLAYGWKVDPLVFALLAVAMGLPYLLVGPVAGVIADRLPLRGVMIWSNVAKAGATALFALAQDWPVLLALVFLRGAFDSFFTPARQASIQALTAPGERAAMNGLSLGLNQAAKIVAPGLGGMLLVALAPAEVFLLNAGVSALAALLLLRLAPISRAETGAAAGGMLAQLAEGLHIARDRPALSNALGLMALGFFGVFLYDSFFAPLTRDFGFSEIQLGFILSAVGAGGVAGALFSGGAGRARPFRQIAFAMAASGALVAAVGLSAALAVAPPYPVFFAGSAFVGFTSAAALVPIRTVIQNETPPSHMARMAALGEAINTLAILSAPFIGAAIAGATTLGHAFVAGGAVALLGAVLAMRADRA